MPCFSVPGPKLSTRVTWADFFRRTLLVVILYRGARTWWYGRLCPTIFPTWIIGVNSFLTSVLTNSGTWSAPYIRRNVTWTTTSMRSTIRAFSWPWLGTTCKSQDLFVKFEQSSTIIRAFMFVKLCECFMKLWSMKHFIVSWKFQCFNETFHILTSLDTLSTLAFICDIRVWNYLRVRSCDRQYLFIIIKRNCTD